MCATAALRGFIETLHNTRIVLETAEGVMLAVNPVMSVNVVLVVVNESTLVTDTTCNTFPPAATAAST